MALSREVSNLGSGLQIFLIISVIVTILVILIIMLRKNKKDEKVNPETYQRSAYKRKLRELKLSKDPSNVTLQNIDSIAREFFQKELGIEKRMDYEEIKDLMNKNKKYQISSFCQKITEALYSGREINKSELDELINLLYIIITLEERDYLEKISSKNKLNLEKVLPVTGDLPENKITIKKSNYLPKKIILKKKPSKNETKHHKFIHSIDILDRLKKKKR